MKRTRTASNQELAFAVVSAAAPAQPYALKLTGAGRPNEGRLEIYTSGMWAGMSSDAYGLLNITEKGWVADAACKDLG